MQRKVLVTGGAGFIGSAVCRRLVGEGASVLNLDALTYAGNLQSLATIDNAPNYRFAKADICDRRAVARGVRDLRSRPCHPSRRREPRRSLDHRQRRFHPDQRRRHVHHARGGARLLEALKRAAAGRIPLPACLDRRGLRLAWDDGAFVEETPYDPSSPYSASKAAADHLVSAWARTYGFPAVISNCSNNYGPYHFPEKLIPLIILNALHGKPLPVYGAGANVRDWLYVEDHARALDLIVARGRIGEKYNVGGRNERRNIDVVRRICAILDELRPRPRPHESLIAFVADRPGHDLRYAIDATKLERELGWRALETFESGIEKTVRWYLDNEWWWRPLREKVYAGERLGVIAEAGTVA